MKTSQEKIEQLAELCRQDERFKDSYKIVTYGPFGLRAYSCLYITDSNSEIVGHLTIETDVERRRYLYENGQIIKDMYPENSIGYYNNMNHRTAPLPDSDEEILNIITEEAAAYFGNQKSVDDVAKIIQSRISIYVNENS